MTRTEDTTHESDPLLRALASLAVAPLDGLAKQLVAHSARVEGPAGPCFVAFGPAGLCYIELATAVDDDPAHFAERYRERFGRPLHPIGEAPAAIRRAVAGVSGHSDLIDLSLLAPFDRAVLEKTDEIPRGEIRPYAWVAAEIGRPKAVRAVGSALGRNPVPFVIPCHRVVRSDGSVGNYGFGPAVKVALLRDEGIDLDDRSAIVRGGLRLMASRATHVACYPTCHVARQITASNRVEFASLLSAWAEGYRPCARCRTCRRASTHAWCRIPPVEPSATLARCTPLKHLGAHQPRPVTTTRAKNSRRDR